MPGEPRALWASNRVCEAAVRHRKQEQHLHNLRNIKPMIDNRDPRRPKQGNSKGARLEEGSQFFRAGINFGHEIFVFNKGPPQAVEEFGQGSPGSGRKQQEKDSLPDIGIENQGEKPEEDSCRT